MGGLVVPLLVGLEGVGPKIAGGRQPANDVPVLELGEEGGWGGAGEMQPRSMENPATQRCPTPRGWLWPIHLPTGPLDGWCSFLEASGWVCHEPLVLKEENKESD